jgi:arginyl-tRNA synthetase
MKILAELQNSFRQALLAVAGERVDAAGLDELVAMVRPSQDPKFGDYQANCAMSLGKKLGKPPRAIATALVEQVTGQPDWEALCEQPKVEGPGFINLRIRTDWLRRQLTAAAADERLGIAPVEKPRTVVIDYSAPNVAKPMHVGHIRSTVIGDALYRILKFLGHTVISDNHIGDWGTQFGMLIYGRKEGFFKGKEHYSTLEKVGELGTIYQQVNRLSGENAEAAKKIRLETAKLHADDAENLKIWREILELGLSAIHQTYDTLGVSFDLELGESFYRYHLSGVVEDLLNRKIARPTEGAIGIFFDDEPESPPFLVQKNDGAFLYATTDLATIKHRVGRYHPDAILYVVDHRQSLHFTHLFKAARKWLGLNNVEMTHISFGTVLGEDGKPFKTRSSDTIGLTSLLDEAVSRALTVVATNDETKLGGPGLSAEDREEVAKAVGIGAIKYADLSHNRTSDYVFSYDKMLAMNGNTATYIQYAYARVRNIFVRGELQTIVSQEPPIAGESLSIDHPAERELGLELLRFSEALDAVVTDYRPNHLTSYLFELANRFSTFYEQCPVLKADTPEQRRNRLALCDLTARTLRLGLSLLGINVVEKM